MFQSAHLTWQLDGDLFQEQREVLTSIITNRVKPTRPDGLNITTQSCFDLLPVASLAPPRPSHDLGWRVSISAARLQRTYFISTAMYLLSNNLHHREDDDKGLEIFCSILERDPRQTFELLHSRLPSTRAAWYALLCHSAMIHRKDTFRLLIDIGIRNAWLDSQLPVGFLLRHAVKMDCHDTVKQLVTLCRSGCDSWVPYLNTMISAIRHGKTESARILVEHCNLSAGASWTVREVLASRFQKFLCKVDIHNDGDARAVEFLLTMGANVDELFHWSLMDIWGMPSIGFGSYESPIEWYYGRGIDDWMRLTILEHIFYFNRPLYEKVAPYSRVPGSDISRTGLLLALECGTGALKSYLEARVTATSSFTWQRVHSYMELIIAEQFMLQDEDGSSLLTSPRSMGYYDRLGPPRRGYREIDLQIVRGLVDYGVDLTLPSIYVGIQDLLGAVLRQLSRQCTDDGLELITMLTRSGASIMGPHLRMVVEHHGFQVLECLALLVDDFTAKAVLALAEAARLNNFEAVEFLLRAGVDPCSFVPGEELEDENMKDSSYSIQAIAAVCTEKESCASSDTMIKCLAKHGARLVVTPADSSPFDFILHLLRYSHSDTFRKVEYAVQVLKECHQFFVFPPYLFESCVNPQYPHLCHHAKVSQQEGQVKARLDILKYLLSQGASVTPGPCLAALICAGGSEQLVEKVVHSRADLNAYCMSCMPGHECKRTPLQASAASGNEHLVRLLLAAGSNVNSPACGEGAKTALQAICSWDTATEEEYDRKLRICQLLISKGANVNAAPARVSGCTALQAAAQLGHLEIAALLLRNGARVNAPDGGSPGRTALDDAVLCGRLDTVKFLLNANALSYLRGATGYDGALKLATDENRVAIAPMIREHAATNMALELINPELLKPQEDYHIYGYVTDRRYDINTYNPNVLREDCTVDSLCTYCAGTAPELE